MVHRTIDILTPRSETSTTVPFVLQRFWKHSTVVHRSALRTILLPVNPVSYTLYSVAYRTVDAFNTQEQKLKQFAVYASANFTRYSVVDSFDVQLLASVAYVSYTLCSEVHSSCNVQLIGAKSLPCIIHTVLRSTQFVQRSTHRSKITTMYCTHCTQKYTGRATFNS